MRVLIDKRRLARFARCEKGTSAVEYGLIIAMIVLAIMSALISVAGKTTGMWNNVSNEVNGH